MVVAKFMFGNKKVMRGINLCYFLLPIFLFSSCYLSTKESQRKKIIKTNPEVISVGIILDWTSSDEKYLALELILGSGKRLLLTTVNYRNFPDTEPFELRKVGNYAFATVDCFVHKRTGEIIMNLRTNQVFDLPKLSAKTGVRISAIGDLIKYYDDINNYIESLPTVNEENYQSFFDEGLLTRETIEKNETYYVTTYTVKTVWNDEYYGTRNSYPRMPDYDGNEYIIVPYFE